MDHTNVDREELAKFGRIGRYMNLNFYHFLIFTLSSISEWWDSSSNAGVGPLHAMNPVRVQFVRENLAQLHNTEKLSPLRQLKGLEILDIGCGGGLLAESLARLGANVTAIDPSKENIEVARMHSANDPLTSKIDYKISTIQEQALLSKKFDAVCALEVRCCVFSVFCCALLTFDVHNR
jgi:ubiquinone biosynthesis O-methyltransferase